VSGFATCAGFRAEVLPAIAAHGASVELGDELPFTELFAGEDRGLVVVLVAVAVRLRGAVPLAVEEILGAPLSGPGAPVVRLLHRAAVDALAAIDDLSLAALWTEALAQLGRPGTPPPDLSQAIRGLVVQCRAAVANGWEVFVVEVDEAAPRNGRNP
jgi:hypothetical protein